MEACKFEYIILGEGNITIVIETGIGNSYYDWFPIADKIKDSCRILLYHRLGYGFSRKSELPRTTENICKELTILLKDLRIDRFVLIGHSFGGLCSQHYAKMHPHNLLGLIIVDSTSPKMIELDRLDTPFIIKHCSVKRMIEMSNEFAAMSKDELALNSEPAIVKRKSYLTDLSYNSKFMIAEHSDHMIHIYKPEVIIKAIEYIEETVSSING